MMIEISPTYIQQIQHVDKRAASVNNLSDCKAINNNVNQQRPEAMNHCQLVTSSYGLGIN